MKKQRKQQIRRTRRKYSYGEFLVLLPLCCRKHQKELLDTLSQAKRPKFIGKYEVPENLNAISYGLLDDLRNASKDDDPLAKSMTLVLGMTITEVYQSNVFDVFGFMNFIKDEIVKINNLFSALKVRYNSDELAAGVKDLDFGSFGVLDWYARRMGITNQNEVRDVAWVRIYNCMKHDVEQNNYERRLHQQYQNRMKRK